MCCRRWARIRAMTDDEIATMFGKTPRDLFRVHDWRNDIVTLGEVPRRVPAAR